MFKEFLALKKLNGIVLANSKEVEDANTLFTFQVEFASLGFMLDKDSASYLSSHMSKKNIKVLESVLTAARNIKGADVDYKPMYPDFPTQVMNMSEAELYTIAFIHYWSFGTWLPEFDKTPRKRKIERTSFRNISLVSDDDFRGIFTSILGSNDSVSDEDREAIVWFMANYKDKELVFPKTIPFKENVAVIAGLFLDRGRDISGLVSNATDVLRVLTYLSGGDVSLSSNTKFVSLPRAKRRLIVSALEGVYSLEDLNRHRAKWVRAFHSLHIGEYSKPLRKAADRIRSGKNIPTWGTEVEKALAANDKRALSLLAQRPSELVRRLDAILRSNAYDVDEVLSSLEGSISSVSTRVLTQVYGHFKGRNARIEKRVIFPKSAGAQKSLLLTKPLEKLPKKTVNAVNKIIAKELKRRFADLEPLGNVYVDEGLAGCPLPTQMRSASTAAYNVARGTRFPLAGDKKCIRLFTYWVGQDIDLSVTFHDEAFRKTGDVSYTNLRDGTVACHSGDITRAPNGAAEFIDINIENALERGYRYAALNVYVFSGPTFAEHKTCYTGWMLRDKPKSNEIFEPATVENKLDMTGEGKFAIPVVFDLKERCVISVDLVTGGRSFSWGAGRIQGLNYGGNNVHTNKAKIEEIVESMLTLDNKMTLKDLAELHVRGRKRSKLVKSRDEADFVFGLDFEDDISPYKINEINEKLIA